MNDLTTVALLGTGATVTMDLWGLARKPLLGVAAPDYSLLGRWVGHMRNGQFHHVAISKSPPVRGERALGWTVHYLTGMAFAAMLLAIAGRTWLQQPTIGPALAVGIGSVAAPFLLMQPAMGAGIASRRSPNPNRARLQSLLTHAVFGVGLFLSARALLLLSTP